MGNNSVCNTAITVELQADVDTNSRFTMTQFIKLNNANYFCLFFFRRIYENI